MNDFCDKYTQAATTSQEIYSSEHHGKDTGDYILNNGTRPWLLKIDRPTLRLFFFRARASFASRPLSPICLLVHRSLRRRLLRCSGIPVTFAIRLAG